MPSVTDNAARQKRATFHTDVEHTCGAAMTTVIGGKLKFLGDKPKKKKKRNRLFWKMVQR